MHCRADALEVALSAWQLETGMSCRYKSHGLILRQVRNQPGGYMDLNLAEVRAKGDKALMDFLTADLDLGFTFAQLSQLEKTLDEPASKQARHHAQRVIVTVGHFSDRLADEEQVHAIKRRLAELEQLVSTI